MQELPDWHSDLVTEGCLRRTAPPGCGSASSTMSARRLTLPEAAALCL